MNKINTIVGYLKFRESRVFVQLNFFVFRICNNAYCPYIVGGNPQFAIRSFDKTITAFNTVHKSACRIGQTVELFSFRVKTVYFTIISLKPNVSEFILVNIVNAVVGNVTVVARMRFVHGKLVTIKFIQLIPGSEPHKAFPILQNLIHGVLRKTVPDIHRSEIVMNSILRTDRQYRP